MQASPELKHRLSDVILCNLLQGGIITQVEAAQYRYSLEGMNFIELQGMLIGSHRAMESSPYCYPYAIPLQPVSLS